MNKTNKLLQAQLTEISKNIKNSGLHISKVAHTERFVVLYLCYMLIGAHRRNINVLFFSRKQKNLMACGNFFFINKVVQAIYIGSILLGFKIEHPRYTFLM